MALINLLRVYKKIHKDTNDNKTIKLKEKYRQLGIVRMSVFASAIPPTNEAPQKPLFS
jgi:hypothetical protein